MKVKYILYYRNYRMITLVLLKKVISLHSGDAGISALLLYPNIVQRFSPGFIFDPITSTAKLTNLLL